MLAEAKSKEGFYGWYALAGTMLVYFIGCGTLFYSFSVFKPDMRADLGWSDLGANLLVALFVLIHGLPGPLIGASVAKFGPRLNMIGGNLVAAIGLAGMSQVSQLWEACLFYGVLAGLGNGFGLYVACTTVGNNWFVQRKGTALGLLLVAGGLGSFVFAPTIGFLIEHFGWQSSWFILSIIQVIGAVVIGAGMLVRNRPEDMGQVPDGRSADIAEASTAETQPKLKVYQTPVEWAPQQAMRQISTWLILIFGTSNMLAVMMLTTNLVEYLKSDIGFSGSEASLALGLCGGLSIVGRLGFGRLSSIIEARYLAAFCMAAQVVALFIIRDISSSSMVPVLIYVVLFGIGYGGLVVALPTILGRYYGRIHYAQILGRIMPFTAAAGAGGPLLAGYIHDSTGTYQLVFTVLIIASLIGLVSALMARPPKIPASTSSNLQGVDSTTRVD
ncbi:MAG: MFS transporter [Chloroflexota bacterium]|nr:MFS transporter [Chloroflexota bacterium]